MQELIGALSLASIYVLFALGMSLTWGTIDILNFAHGSIFMFSAFTAYLVLQSTSLSFFVVLLIGVVVGAAMSLLTQVLAFEQIIKRAKDKRSAEMQILIGGIGVAIIPLSIAQHYTKSNPFGFENSSFQVTKITFGDYWVTNVQLITIVLAAVLGIATAWWLRRSRQGLALRSIGVDSEVASPVRQAAGCAAPSTGESSRWRPWRSPEPWPGSPASCSRTASAPSRPRAATRCWSRRSPASSSAASAARPGCTWGRSSSRPPRPWSSRRRTGSGSTRSRSA